MKIYYIASIAASDKYGDNFRKINEILIKQGHEINNENFMGLKIGDLNRDKEYRVKHYDKVIKTIKNSDVIVSEVSFPSSINVGHEITKAIDYEKPVLALYSKGNSPIFLEGYESEKFILVEYDSTNPSELERIIKINIKKLMKATDIRFNFFISPKISNYLDWVAKKKRIPRSVYLRKLIEEDMTTQQYES